MKPCLSKFQPGESSRRLGEKDTVVDSSDRWRLSARALLSSGLAGLPPHLATLLVFSSARSQWPDTIHQLPLLLSATWQPRLRAGPAVRVLLFVRTIR